MSLRRRPAEAATYIPATSSGFGLTTSGALGFSEDVERRLSTPQTTSSHMFSAAKPSVATAAAPDSGMKKSSTEVTCNRDAVGMIRPFASFSANAAAAASARTNAGFGMYHGSDNEDEEQEMMHLGEEFKMPSGDDYHKKMAGVMSKTKIKDWRLVNVGMHLNIVNEYMVWRSTFGYVNRSKIQNIFDSYTRFESEGADYHKDWVKLVVQLNVLCGEVVNLWQHSTYYNSDLKSTVPITFLVYVKMPKDDVHAAMYKECMEKYMQADELVRRMDTFIAAKNMKKIHRDRHAEQKTATYEQTAHAAKIRKEKLDVQKAVKEAMEEHHAKTAAKRAEKHSADTSHHTHTATSGQHSHTNQKDAVRVHMGNGEYVEVHRDDVRKVQAQKREAAAGGVAPQHMGVPKKVKAKMSIADMQHAIRAKTMEIQQRLDDHKNQLTLGSRMQDANSGMYCQCSDPVPVSSSMMMSRRNQLRTESGYCQCSDPVPISSSMYCQCSDPVPVSSRMMSRRNQPMMTGSGFCQCSDPVPVWTGPHMHGEDPDESGVNGTENGEHVKGAHKTRKNAHKHGTPTHHTPHEVPNAPRKQKHAGTSQANGNGSAAARRLDYGSMSANGCSSAFTGSRLMPGDDDDFF